MFAGIVNLISNRYSNESDKIEDVSTTNHYSRTKFDLPTVEPSKREVYSRKVIPEAKENFNTTSLPQRPIINGNRSPVKTQHNPPLANQNVRVKESVKGTGKITVLSLELPKGVIEGKYIFNKEDFCKTGSQFVVGTQVDFEAEKSFGDCEFTVTSMKIHKKVIINEPEVQLKHCRKFLVKIIEISEGFVTVQWGKEKEICKLKKEKLPILKSFIIPGDWFRVDVRKEENSSNDDETAEDEMSFGEVADEDIIQIEPTQQKTVVGKFIRKKNYSVINNDIYCLNETLPSDSFFHSGVTVKVTAVESEQVVSVTKGTKTYNWRAVDISLSAFASYMNINVDDADPETKKNEQELVDLLEDKKGVQITPSSIHFGNVKLGQQVEKEIEIFNNSPFTLTLKDIRVVGDQTVCDFVPVVVRRESNDFIAMLESTQKYIFKIECKPTERGIGRTKELCVFDFGDFKVARYVNVNILCGGEESADLQSIRYNKDQEKPKRNWKKNRNEEVKEMMTDSNRTRVRAPPPVRAPFFPPRRIPTFPIPGVVWQVFETQDEPLMTKSYPRILNPLVFDNYLEKFSVCLWFEELENDRKRRETDLKNIVLSHHKGEIFFCKVPGLKDFQPPLLVSDPLDVLKSADKAAMKYEGYIYKIVDTTIYIRFDPSFYQVYQGEPLTVQFRIGRMTYKRNHFAINEIINYLGRDFLFPKDNISIKSPKIFFTEDIENHENGNDFDGQVKEEDDKPSVRLFSANNKSVRAKVANIHTNGVNRRAASIKKPFNSDSAESNSSVSNPVKLQWFNKSLNEEQKSAVRNILLGQARPLPYIIFGPPGTGKTVTLVESIMQVTHLDPNSRLLVCAPSNAAADVIAIHLLKSKKYNPGDFVRLNGFMRAADGQFPDQLKPYCVDGEHLDEIITHKMVICTCVSAGQFFQLVMAEGHFTHVFVDEAGYCTEPETMIPTVLMAANKGGQLILAGDPFQLGPVLMSDPATNIGLDISFLQRLMEKVPIYQRNLEKFPETRYNPALITKLVKNYRTNETLLKIPSQLFYDDELVACASYEDSYALCQNPNICREILQAHGVPIVFHGIQGSSSREADSPSWFNTAEVMEVVKYVKKLKHAGLTSDDIGIITPYRKQVDKIKTALVLGQLNLKENEVPKVGSVEEFQGGERKVIIISTVRSIYESKVDQQVGRMMFIYSPKRFNVAMTRAKALLIVIGNPHILCKNLHWKRLITYSKELGTYKGCNLPFHLEPKYLKELEKAQLENNTSALTNPPDKANKLYNPDGLDSDED